MFVCVSVCARVCLCACVLVCLCVCVCACVSGWADLRWFGGLSERVSEWDLGGWVGGQLGRWVCLCRERMGLREGRVGGRVVGIAVRASWCAGGWVAVLPR